MNSQEILKKLQEPLRVEDVDFRIQSINKGGYATILAYKDARVDMNRLDAVCGVNWQDDYKVLEGQLYCGIAIKIEKEWIWRWDVGIESYTEKVKGRASDAFKRAGFRWGIGRELYDYPKISVKLRNDEFTIVGDKAKQTFSLQLDKWKWSYELKDGKVIRLTAKDEKGALRFDSLSGTKQPTAAPAAKQTPPPAQIQIKPTLSKMNGKDFSREWFNILQGIAKGKITSLNDVKKYYTVPDAIARDIINQLNSKLKSA